MFSREFLVQGDGGGGGGGGRRKQPVCVSLKRGIEKGLPLMRLIQMQF